MCSSNRECIQFTAYIIYNIFMLYNVYCLSTHNIDRFK